MVNKLRRTEAYIKAKKTSDASIYNEAKLLEQTVSTIKEINEMLAKKYKCHTMTIYNTIKRHESTIENEILHK